VAEIVHGANGPAVTVDGVAPASDAVAVAAANVVYVLRLGRQTRVSLRDLALDEAGDGGAGGVVRAPMHGKVLSVLVEKGDRVTRGQRLAIIEAMKMEHTLVASMDGTVAELAVSQDAQVGEGAKVMVIAQQE
jgi:3-methylcrotonyl-CoA carboxylase alpha subunit